MHVAGKANDLGLDVLAPGTDAAPLPLDRATAEHCILGGADGPALDAAQLSGDLGPVGSEGAQQCVASFVKKPCRDLARREEVVAGDIASGRQSLGEVHDHSGGQVLFGRTELVGLAGVHLLFPRVAGPGVARVPYLDPVPGRFAGHVLPERTPSCG